MNLIKSKIVPAKFDAGWDAELTQLAGLSPQPMLALSPPFGAGSTEEITLTNMLKACGFGPDAVNVIQLGSDEILPWPRLRDAAFPQFALLLGIKPAQLCVEAQLPFGLPSEFGGVSFIVTHSLKELTANEAARKSLWTDILKPLFKGG